MEPQKLGNFSGPGPEIVKRETCQRGRDCMGSQRVRVALTVWPAHQPLGSAGETSARGPIVA